MSVILELFRFPIFRKGALHIWERNFLVFRSGIVEASLSVVIEPLVFYWALAFGLGQYVDVINGLSFVEFLFPGFMLVTAMVVSYVESSQNCFLRITPEGQYANYRYTPLSLDEIAIGEILWGASKGFLSGASVAVFAFQQDFFTIHDLGAVLTVLLLASFLFSAVGFLVMTVAKGYETLSIAFAVVIIPTYLLSGALFPLDALPEIYSLVSLCLPLTHLLLFLRSSLVEIYDLQSYIHLLTVTLLTIFLLNLSVSRFNKRFRK